VDPGPGEPARQRRAAHHLADDDDLADIEFGSDEEAREAGFVPGWQISRHLCTDPGQYGHANVHGTPSGTPTPAQQTAEDQAAAARQTDERRRSGSGTPNGGPQPKPARPTSRRCWAAKPRHRAR
jgi:hypothetical protein